MGLRGEWTRGTPGPAVSSSALTSTESELGDSSLWGVRRLLNGMVLTHITLKVSANKSHPILDNLTSCGYNYTPY